MENVRDGHVTTSSATIITETESTTSTNIDMPVPIKNGEVLLAEKLETANETKLISDLKVAKVNGGTKGNDSEGVDSSDCDTLVIDERPQNNRKRKIIESKGGFKGFKKAKTENEYEPPINPYFNESLFELSALHHNKDLHSNEKSRVENLCANEIIQNVQNPEDLSTTSVVTVVQPKKGTGKKNKKNSSPKLREYAQYLGLQPTVQFKCPNCGQTGFQSLALLNEHHKDCNSIGPVVQSTSPSTSSSTNFRVTRRVFLCSACGTYYENWNLFLHMREVHRRFICLYCLGMFSLPEKLSLHLTSKHNCVPNNSLSEENFFQVYKEPCFIMCCDCEIVFNERDNFFSHNCQGKPNRINNSESKSNKMNTNKHLNNQKQSGNKNVVKQLKNKSFVAHVTGDTPEVTDEVVAAESSNERLIEKEDNNINSKDEEEDEEKKDKSETNELQSNLEPIIAQTPKDTPNDVIEEEEGEEDTNPEISNNVNTSSSSSSASASSEEVMETDDKNETIKTVEPDLSINERQHSEQNEHEPISPDQHPTKTDEIDEIENKDDLEDDSSSLRHPQLDSSLETTATDEVEANQEDSNLIDDDDLNEEPIKSPDLQVQEDTRKVPKVTLKLPKSITATNYAEHEDSDDDDSDKLTMEVDSAEKSEKQDFNDFSDFNDFPNSHEDDTNFEEKENKDSTNIADSLSLVVAGGDIPIVELELEQPLDKFDIQILLQKCLKATVPTCVYCNHARKIAVNGRQLGLHAIAEHRFSAIVNSITAEELMPETFVMRIKESLPELQDVYFNLESTLSEEGITFSHIFECFQCRYSTTIHKELYLHNRKMHAKTILLCIMCKSNFYSYSELICHLCPGLYELNNEVSFRCCMCVNDDLPSAFRLMVHLRKRHHACDVCLELCHNQSRLSNHVWKHKLHHLCYRCGIAYRNKPDITKHLFWKHGTESVLCKKCLQKKWPHVYHFCIPPSSFTCEECNLNFTKAVSLKVHKRLHMDEKPHACTFENCFEKFISRKLLLKHEFKHREPPEEIVNKNHETDIEENVTAEAEQTSNAENQEDKAEDVAKDETSQDSIDKPKPKPKIDVYDLPELNLSESDSSDSEDETPKNEKKNEEVQLQLDDKMPDLGNIDFMENTNLSSSGLMESIMGMQEGSSEQPVPILENIWDDFKNYQASKEKIDILGQVGGEASDLNNTDIPSTSGMQENSTSTSAENQQRLVKIVMMDHDYSAISLEYKSEVEPQVIERTQSMDHDYCSASVEKQKPEEQLSSTDYPKQKSQSLPATSKDKRDSKASSSSDSSDSDSSSCTCGSNCSCSSSSNSSSSSSASSDSDSSSSEGRRKQQVRRERRKLRATKNKNSSNNNSHKESKNSPPIDVVTTDQQPAIQTEQLIQESDLDTTETETDEDFYDKQPQKIANKLIAEKRKELLLLAGIGPLVNGSVLESSRPSTPSLPETEEVKPKKKSKNKKKKKKSKKQEMKPILPSVNIPSASYQYQYQPSIVSPLMISLPKNSPMTTPTASTTHASASPLGNASRLSMEEPMLMSSSNMDTSNMNDSSLRASKRKRVPNKFYGYSSDEERNRHLPPVLKWRKADLPSPARPAPSSPLVVPPITIKTIPSVAVAEEPMRPSIQEIRMQQQQQQHQQAGLMQQNFQQPPHMQTQDPESSTESNGSSSDEEQQSSPQQQPFVNKPNQPPLYCYCRCPYDEVSEMIGCDSNDCSIEWFHFECVGIMVPPKGQWFCPDCRKKKQLKKELAQT